MKKNWQGLIYLEGPKSHLGSILTCFKPIFYGKIKNPRFMKNVLLCSINLLPRLCFITWVMIYNLATEPTIVDFGICPYQLGNKFPKETILNIWRNEKYFSVLLIYQLFGYNVGKIKYKNLVYNDFNWILPK